MNPTQVARQIRHVLGSMLWPPVAGGDDPQPVFGERSVRIVAGELQPNELPPAFPIALVAVDAGQPDADHPGLIAQTFTVAIAVAVFGDQYGEHAVVGGPRADLTASPGAGVLEVAAQARAALQQLTGADGAPVTLSASGVSGIRNVDKRHLAVETFTLSALCTTEPVYTAPQLVRRPTVANILRWHGTRCSRRHDFLQFRVGYRDLSAGLPTSPDQWDGTAYTGTATEAAITFVPRRYYVVVADYDPRGTGSVGYSSAAERGSYITT